LKRPVARADAPRRLGFRQEAVVVFFALPLLPVLVPLRVQDIIGDEGRDVVK
jgi:hypothetical protein